MDEKTAHSAMLDGLTHEITLIDEQMQSLEQSLSRDCEKLIQETLGDKLMLESRPDKEPEPDDHLGYELGSELMWVSGPDVEPGQDDDQNEW